MVKNTQKKHDFTTKISKTFDFFGQKSKKNNRHVFLGAFIWNHPFAKKFCQLRRLVFDQSSPVQPISKSRGGGGSPEKSGERKTKILVSNIRFNSPTIVGLLNDYEAHHSYKTAPQHRVHIYRPVWHL